MLDKAKPGKNPCRSAYDGHPLTRKEQIFEATSLSARETSDMYLGLSHLSIGCDWLDGSEKTRKDRR